TYTVQPHFIGMGTGSHTAAKADTALTTEVETRTTGTTTYTTTTNTNDTLNIEGVVAATAGRTVIEAGLFDASTVGHMFVSATFSAITLNSGDSIDFTFKVQIVN
ncbi:MAG: hypothetical protein ACRD3Q_12430, partial [Terriglobales bacterium]